MLTRLRDKFDPASWTEGGGLGAIELDEAGKYLLVVQSPQGADSDGESARACPGI